MCDTHFSCEISFQGTASVCSGWGRCHISYKTSICIWCLHTISGQSLWGSSPQKPFASSRLHMRLISFLGGKKGLDIWPQSSKFFFVCLFYFIISHPFYTHQCIHVNPNLPVHHTTTPTSRRFPPLVSIRLFSTSVSQFLLCKPVHQYHFLGSTYMR